jgi:hypothetical protein
MITAASPSPDVSSNRDDARMMSDHDDHLGIVRVIRYPLVIMVPRLIPAARPGSSDVTAIERPRLAGHVARHCFRFEFKMKETRWVRLIEG